MRQLRSAHTDEIRRYKEDIALVQDQLSVNREEVANLQSELNHQQGLTAEAENISEQWERDCEAARQQVRIHTHNHIHKHMYNHIHNHVQICNNRTIDPLCIILHFSYILIL